MNDEMRSARTWTPEQLGTFVEEVRDDRFLPLWLLVATTGLRLDTLTGLQRDEVDLHHRRLYPHSRPLAVGDPSHPPTFSRDGYALDPDAYDVLRGHIVEWDKERAKFAPQVRELFLWPGAQPLDPSSVGQMFHQHCVDAGLPDVPLSEVRQAYVVAALQNGIPTKILRERLGDQIDSPSMGIGEVSRRSDSRRPAAARARASIDERAARQPHRSRHLRSL